METVLDDTDRPLLADERLNDPEVADDPYATVALRGTQQEPNIPLGRGKGDAALLTAVCASMFFSGCLSARASLALICVT